MPLGHLKIYRFAEDAWSGGLRTWCEGPRQEGVESWVLLENEGQQRWLSRRLEQAGITGIRFFEADGLRDEFARLAGLPPLPGDGAGAFAVKVVAEEEAAGRDAGSLAEACDELARAGWHLNQLHLEGGLARRLNRMFESAGVLAGFLDRRLHEALPAVAARICCVGWDATHWPDLGLLDLAVAKAADFEMYVPSPRLPAEERQMAWIEMLDARFGFGRLVYIPGTCVSENESLVARLERSDRATPVETPRPALLVGREWGDEVGLVCGQVAAWLAERPAIEEPIGMIAPEDSPTAIAVADALQKAGVPVECRGRAREAEPVERIIEQAARYHVSGRDVAELLELARLLWLYARDRWEALDPEAVREAIDRAFKAAQSRNSRILVQALLRRKDTLWPTVGGLVEGLGRWDGTYTWAKVLEKWKAMISALRLPADMPLPWPEISAEVKAPGGALMDWLAAQSNARARMAPPPEFNAPAAVVVTTFANAAQQTWERLIFLDSNENGWPVAIGENPFLLDSLRNKLNLSRKEGARLLTTRDRRALEEARFLDLVEHCRGAIAFAGVLLEASDAGERAQPNEWVERALLETGEGLPAELWAAAAQTYPPEPPPALEAEERAHMERVHGSRRNGTMPFDKYQFNFNETKLEPGAWAATDLDLAATRPATFALKELFDAESTVDWMPERAEAVAVGTLAHQWLGRILGTGDHLTPAGTARDDEAKLAREAANARRELEQWYGAEDLPMPLWWDTCLRKTEWATRRCLREVRGCLLGGWCATEQKLAVTVETPRGPLLLKGRIDLLISDRPEIRAAVVRMFDFKTGRGAAPTLSSLKNGSGAQFAAYYLMARDAGASEAMIGIIKPEQGTDEVFTKADEEELRAHFGALAEVRRTLRFGRLGPLVDEHGVTETLPLATTPIDPAILEHKAGLFLIAS